MYNIADIVKTHMTINEYRDIKEKLANAKSEKDRAIGKLDTLKSNIKEKYKVGSMKELQSFITEKKELVSQLESHLAELDKKITELWKSMNVS